MHGRAVGSLRGVQGDRAHQDGVGGIVGTPLQRLPAPIPQRRLRQMQSGARRKGQLEIGGLTLQLGGSRPDNATVFDTLPGLKLEEAADRLDLATNISAATSAPAADPPKAHVRRRSAGVL